MRRVELERSASHRYLLYILTVIPLFTVNLIYLLCVTTAHESQNAIIKSDFMGWCSLDVSLRALALTRIAHLCVWIFGNSKPAMGGWASRGRREWRTRLKSSGKAVYQCLSQQTHNPTAFVHTALRFSLNRFSVAEGGDGRGKGFFQRKNFN